MRIRHCDMCNIAMERDGVYIKISLKSDTDQGLVFGAPLELQGDYCSFVCVRERIRLMDGVLPAESLDDVVGVTMRRTMR